MSQLTADGEEFARMLRYAASCIDYSQMVQSYNSCLNCAGKKEPYCPYLPGEDEMARINCPLWYREKRGV